MAIQSGRVTARYDQPVVVFLIGLRVNILWRVWEWAAILADMTRMIRELMQQRDLGLLHVETFIQGRTVLVVQYWSSFAQLEHYARDPNREHLPAWKRFYKHAAKSRAVGIFHETYQVEADSHECVYVNMPPFGLGKVNGVVDATKERETARQRLKKGKMSD